MLIFELIGLGSKIDSEFKKVFMIGYVWLIVFEVLENMGMRVELVGIRGIGVGFIS